MLRSSNCVLTGKTPMEFAKLNECPLDPGTQRKTWSENKYHIVITIIIYLTLLYRGVFYRERSGESYPDPGAAVQESNHCGSGQEGCSWSLCYQVLFSLCSGVFASLKVVFR